jgi:hypothetical protein
MKKVLAILSLVSISLTAVANDGGVAAIKVDQIKMRETALKNGQEVVVKKIVNPSYTITIEGGEAAKLQKILPSVSSVFTGMFPAQAQLYKDSFKSLGIYSEKSAAASSKVLSISCSDAVMNESGEKITKTGKSVCSITINGVSDGVSATDNFGDAQTFEPKTCK